MLRVPGRDHLLTPRHFLGIVRIPDRDRATRLGRGVGITRAAATVTTGDERAGQDNGQQSSLQLHVSSRGLHGATTRGDYTGDYTGGLHRGDAVEPRTMSCAG